MHALPIDDAPRYCRVLTSADRARSITALMAMLIGVAARPSRLKSSITTPSPRHGVVQRRLRRCNAAAAVALGDGLGHQAMCLAQEEQHRVLGPLEHRHVPVDALHAREVSEN